MFMHFDHILVIKETRQHEKRVALTPKAVALLVTKGYRVLVEENAGVNAGFENADYIQAGAQVISFTETGFPANSFIVRVLWNKAQASQENKHFHENTAMLGFLFPFMDLPHITAWQQLGLTTLTFDLFESLSVDDPKNAQAAMSRIAGRLSFCDALKHYQGDKPICVSIIGTGAAGISAAFEANQQGFPVQVFGRTENHRAIFAEAGIAYHVLPSENPIEFIQTHLKESTIVITAARTAGKKAPLLLNETSLRLLPPKAVVVDLAVSNGGNVVGSQHDCIKTMDNGVLVINVSGYPKAEPQTSSEAYAQCVVSVLTEILSSQGDMLFEHPVVQEIWVTHNRQRREALYEKF
jgi:NAD/NADP transhydrogenase alpha subunit